MSNKIQVSLKCKNIAPIVCIDKTIETSSQKLAIFANNGTGKTYLSRIFQLLSQPNPVGDVMSFIRHKENKAEFAFKVMSKGEIFEDISFQIERQQPFQTNETRYTYHVFNQDYVDNNIRALNYQINEQGITGFILGKAQIELADEESKLKELENSGKALREQLESSVKKYIDETISIITNINRLGEYKDLTIENILKQTSVYSKPQKTVEQLIGDYDKIKSIPEQFEPINLLKEIEVNFSYVEDLVELLQKECSVSTISDEFKRTIKNDSNFFEKGVLLSNGKDCCPFCGQTLTQNAIELIDKYVEYFNNEEAKVVKQLADFNQQISDNVKQIKDWQNTYQLICNKFSNYTRNYIPSMENVYLSTISIDEIIGVFNELTKLIERKNKNISDIIEVNDDIIRRISTNIDVLNERVKEDNKSINRLNKKLEQSKDENKRIRKNICLATYYYLCDIHQNEINKIVELRNEYKELNELITQKKEKEKISKKTKVYETIKRVLDYFFNGKYTLEKDTFKLIFNSEAIEKGNIGKVLSEGEKSIIAFAYYLGDTHSRVARIEDYKKIYFIIDDPISSLDYTYVYTMSGIIRDLQNIFENLEHVKYIVLTHNNDFMRILTANNIVEKSFIMQSNSLIEFKENYTVPYISHLLDIYKVANRIIESNHTTANSIRQIIETLTQFCYLDSNNQTIQSYIENSNIDKSKKTYTFINDLSHGGWRSNQAPMLPEDYIETCNVIINHIREIFPEQISYCEKLLN